MGGLIEHDVFLDLTGSGTYDVDGTVGALSGYTVGQLADYTVGELATIFSGEDVSPRVLAGLSAERGRSQLAEQSPPLANEVSGIFDNRSGAFSPTNAGSPLYPNFDTGHTLRWRIQSASTIYPVADAKLTELAPHPEWGAETVGFIALSQLAELVKKTGYSSPLYGDGTVAGGVRSDVALGIVFDTFGLTDPARRDFDVGDTVFLWFCVRPGDEGFDLAMRIWASEGAGARLYDAKDGATTFKRRLAEAIESRSTTAQATFRDTDNGTDPWFAGWVAASGEQHVVNSCSIAHVRRAVDGADAVFWQFGPTVVLGTNESRAFQVQPSSDDLIASVVAPLAATDYVVAAGSVAASTLDRTSGPFVTWTLTAGAGGATLTGLQVRGRLLRVAATTQVSNQDVDTSPSARYGPHPLALPTLPDLDYGVAQAICNGYVQRDMLPRPLRTIDVPLVTPVQIAAALSLEIGDRIAVINGREDFAQQMWVESIKVVAPEDGGAPHAYLGCQAVHESNTLFWDVGHWDLNNWAV